MVMQFGFIRCIPVPQLKIEVKKYHVKYYADILICMIQNCPPDEMASSLKPEQYGDICSLHSPPEILLSQSWRLSIFVCWSF